MSTELEKELERGTQIRGFRFGLHDFEAHMNGVEALKKRNDHVEATIFEKYKGLLDRKARAFAVIVACVAQKDAVSHIQVHMHAARKAGATPEEILELINFIEHFVGSPARLVGLEAWRATFRPDLPTIMRVVELR
jgi:alkylhydroperoxidase/carboxymuconolactone decarboxylase family protein YurZ